MLKKNLGVIIAAGGSSQRYGDADKLTEMLDGIPVFVHSIRNFAAVIPGGFIVVAAHRDNIERYKLLAEKYLPGVFLHWTPGGATRMESVKNALAMLPDSCSLVAVHDAARPLATAELLLRVAEAAERCGGAIAASKNVDSLKLAGDDGMILKAIPRDAVWRAETPQVFNAENFRKAYAELGNGLCTDDAEVMSSAGCRVALVETGFPNFKLTSPADMELLKLCVKRGGTDVQ